MPSSVYVEADGSVLTGRDAVNAARIDATRFEPNPKRRIDDGSVLLGGNDIAVVDLFVAVLSRVASEAQRVAGQVPGSVVLTHPATWGPTRRLVLETAAQRAGFATVDLIPEPVAAAVYFTRALHHRVNVGDAVVVYDLGGGTFDASVVARTSTGFEVLAVDGLADLGGVDVDHALIDHLGARFGDDPAWGHLMTSHGTAERAARRLLYDDVRMAKEALSRTVQTQLPIPLVNTSAHVTRDELEALTRPLLERAVNVTKAVIHASKLSSDRIAGVFLVGGASRMPLAATMLHHATGQAPTVIEQPELIVAQGATPSTHTPPHTPPLTPPPPIPVEVSSPFTPPDLTPPPTPTPDPDPTPPDLAPPLRPDSGSDVGALPRRSAWIVALVVIVVGALGIWLLIKVFPDPGSNGSQDDVKVQPDLKDNEDFFPHGQLKGFASAWYDDVSKCTDDDTGSVDCEPDDETEPGTMSLELYNLNLFQLDHKGARDEIGPDDSANAPQIEKVGDDSAGYMLTADDSSADLYYWDSRYPEMYGHIVASERSTVKSLYQKHKP
jgi:actin-like ATPase involved in cell morphogenesis